MNHRIKVKLAKEKRAVADGHRILRLLTGEHDFTPTLANLLLDCMRRPVQDIPVTIKPALASPTCRTPLSKFKGLGLFSSKPIDAGDMVVVDPGSFWTYSELCEYMNPIPDDIFHKVMGQSYHAPDPDWYSADEKGDPLNMYSLPTYMNHGPPNITRWQVNMPRRVLFEACERNLHPDLRGDPIGVEDDPMIGVTGYIAIRNIEPGEELLIDYAMGGPELRRSTDAAPADGWDREWWWEPIKTRHYIEYWQSMGVENPLLENGVTWKPGDPRLDPSLDIKGKLEASDLPVGSPERLSEVPVRNYRGIRDWADTQGAGLGIVHHRSLSDE